MRLFVAVLLVLSATTAQAACHDTMGELYESLYKFKPGVRSPCDEAPDVQACRVERCVEWDEARAALAAVLGTDSICAELVADKFSGVIAEAETKRIQCNSLQDPLPAKAFECKQVFDEAAELLIRTNDMLSPPLCGDDCAASCARHRAFEAKLTAVTQRCRDKIREHLIELDGNRTITFLSTVRAACDAKGL